MKSRFLLLLFLPLLARPTAAQESQPAAEGYDARLQELGLEVEGIRTELERLVEEVVPRETARVFVFLERPEEGRVAEGLTLRVDGEVVFSRPLTTEELEFGKQRQLVQVADLRLPPGEHSLEVLIPGEGSFGPDSVVAPRGESASWIVRIGKQGVEWREE